MAEEEMGAGKKRRRKPKPSDIADQVLDAQDVAEGRKEQDEDAVLEPTIDPEEVEQAMVTQYDAGTLPSRMRRIRWLQGNRRGKCQTVGYKLASVQIALRRAEYVDLEK